jgi:tetratricopeptide repeat protein 8
VCQLLVTADCLVQWSSFVNLDRLTKVCYDRIHRMVHMVQALEDYLLYVERNPRKALELAAEATVVSDYKDWWWKARLGKCYHKLGITNNVLYFV